MTIKTDFAAEMAKASPPVTVVGVTLGGISLSDVTYGLTAVYTLCMLYFLLRDKWWRQRGKPKG